MRDLKWKVLSTNYVYENKWLHVRADSCMLPDERIIEKLLKEKNQPQ